MGGSTRERSAADRGWVGEVVARAPCVALHAGELRAAGTLPEARFLVVSAGTVAALAPVPAGARRIVTSLSGPDCVLLPPDGRGALRAITDAVVVAVPDRVHEALMADAASAGKINDALAEAARERDENLAILAMVEHVGRVERKLIQLARRHGRVVRGGVVVPLPLTHELLGAMVGSARETVTGAVRTLTERGVLDRRDGFYRVKVSADALTLDAPL